MASIFLLQNFLVHFIPKITILIYLFEQTNVIF